jgi:hypothetical protein
MRTLENALDRLEESDLTVKRIGEIYLSRLASFSVVWISGSETERGESWQKWGEAKTFWIPHAALARTSRVSR